MVAISSGGEKQPKEPGPRTRKRKEPPSTTGRKSDGKNDRVKIQVKRRVKMSRSQLYHISISDEQRGMIPKDVPNKYHFFGTVVSRGKKKSSWNVKFDILPSDDNVIQNISQAKLIVVGGWRLMVWVCHYGC
jgi:hypothetical protein